VEDLPSMTAGALRSARTATRAAFIRASFRARGPWVTRFRIDGRTYGGWADFTDDDRIRDFSERFEPCRVLELGCLEAGQTVELARRGYSVTAIEGRPENVRRARWICRMFEVDARVVAADLERMPLRDFGRFDVVFCSGVLYHLPRPWDLVEQLPAVAPSLFLSTHYAEAGEVSVHGLAGRWYTEHGRGDPLSGLSERSFWPTKTALLDLLRATGYGAIEITSDYEHPNGPLLSLAAQTATKGAT
jgi:SAM-dependent methyltransferase